MEEEFKHFHNKNLRKEKKDGIEEIAEETLKEVDHSLKELQRLEEDYNNLFNERNDYVNQKKDEEEYNGKAKIETINAIKGIENELSEIIKRMQELQKKIQKN